MNNITVQGNLVTDPNIIYLDSGLAIVKLTLADNSFKKKGNEILQETIFWQIQFFGKIAENIGNTLCKGKKITVVGTAVPNNYTDKKGVERRDIRILGSKFEYCEKKGK